MLKFQKVCPYNRELTETSIVIHEEFTSEEMEYILDKPVNNVDKVSKAVEEKMINLGLSSHKDCVVRNLRSIINNFYK